MNAIGVTVTNNNMPSPSNRKKRQYLLLRVLYAMLSLNDAVAFETRTSQANLKKYSAKGIPSPSHNYEYHLPMTVDNYGEYLQKNVSLR